MGKQQENKAKTGDIKRRNWIIAVVVILGLGLLGSSNSSKTQQSPSASPTPEPTVEPTPTPTPKVHLSDALRWCQVMEGRDLYLYTYDSKTPPGVNVFDDAYKSCESDLNAWGSDDFIKIVTEDWNGEYGKDSTIEGKTLQEYLEILNK